MLLIPPAIFEDESCKDVIAAVWRVISHNVECGIPGPQCTKPSESSNEGQGASYVVYYTRLAQPERVKLKILVFDDSTLSQP